MAVCLIAITFAGTLRSINLVWISLGAAAIGAIVWASPMPNLYQLMIFAAIAAGGIALSQLFIKSKDDEPASQQERQEEEPVVIKAPNPRRLIHQTFTLTEPIVDGAGRIVRIRRRVNASM